MPLDDFNNATGTASIYGVLWTVDASVSHTREVMAEARSLVKHY